MPRRSSLPRLTAGAARLGTDRRGSVLVMFALSVPVILGATLAVIDYSRATAAKAELQNILDAAALYAARSNVQTPAEIQALGMRMMSANLPTIPDATLTHATFRMDANQRVFADAEITLPVTVASFVGMPKVTIGSTSQVQRNSNNVEVGVALDITGSMAGQPLVDLKAAAKDLVDLVVKDQQTPFYSKVALVPYSMAVNVGSYAPNVRGNVSSGRADTPGSEQYRFRRYSNNGWQTQNISTCVTERTGGNAYTDAVPLTNTPTTWVGRHYNSPGGSGNECPSAQFMPMSSNKAVLKAAIDTYQAVGSTAGHIGLAWAWYAISPRFGGIFPTASRGAAYGSRDLLKVVILMTDGEFNTPYANGVISRDAGDGSGSADYKINQNATNGSSFSQATQLCTSMKNAGVIVYTVGLGVQSNPDSHSVLTNCATSAKHVYFPNSGTALKDAFRAIGQEINSLRIAQ